MTKLQEKNAQELQAAGALDVVSKTSKVLQQEQEIIEFEVKPVSVDTYTNLLQEELTSINNTFGIDSKDFIKLASNFGASLYKAGLKSKLTNALTVK